MKLLREEQILEQDFRKKYIESCIDSPQNESRKAYAFKAWECLKDKTWFYVIDLLLKQFKPETVNEMQYATTNISIFRKVIDKLARVYQNGASRSLETIEATSQLEEVAEHIEINQVMKKINKYYRAFWNTLAYVKPKKAEELYDLMVEPLAPFNYDVIENPENPQEAMVVIVSDYQPLKPNLYALGDAAVAGRTGSNVKIAYPSMTGSNYEDDKRKFVWWSKNYHFTTNAKGELISQGDGINPIGALPFVNFTRDQCNKFWSEGGEDLVDSGIKINAMLTNIQHVAITQGYGQLYMTGKNLPKSITTGPNHCIQVEVEEGQPNPQIGYLNSNPPINELVSMVETTIALMLTTNNLSTSGISTNLQGGKQFASGIALMIDKAESIEDVNEQAEIFIRQEPKIWELLDKWYNYYNSKGLLVEEWKENPLPPNSGEVDIEFPKPRQLNDEMGQLAVYEKRLELGLNTKAEIIKMDNPSLTEEQANDKIKEIEEEKAAAMTSMQESVGNDQSGPIPPQVKNEGNQGNGQQQQDSLND